MTPRQRLWFFAVAAAGLVACYLWAFTGLPGFGGYPGPYGQEILRVAVQQTNATGVVSAINFEYRGFDTVGRYLRSSRPGRRGRDPVCRIRIGRG